MKFALRLALDLVIFLAVAGAFTLNASASTLPGDPLYGVKRTWEEVRLTLTTSDQAHQQLQAQLEAERRAEIEKLIQLRRPVFVEFEGNLDQMGSDTWVVNGLQFKLLPETIVQGTPALGQRVWLRASIQADGQMIVREVRVENSAYPGPSSQGTFVPQVQSTAAPLPTNVVTSIPGQMPWGSQSPVQTPVPGQWMNTMPHNYDDYHHANPSSTSAPTAPTSQSAAPTNQHHNQPSSTQQPSDNHHQDPNQCMDCSHNNWDNHSGDYHH